MTSQCHRHCEDRIVKLCDLHNFTTKSKPFYKYFNLFVRSSDKVNDFLEIKIRHVPFTFEDMKEIASLASKMHQNELNQPICSIMVVLQLNECCPCPAAWIPMAGPAESGGCEWMLKFRLLQRGAADLFDRSW